MTEYLIAVVTAALITDALLSRLTGKREEDVIARLQRAVRFGGVTVAVTISAAIVSHALYRGVLAPLGLESLRAVLFLLVAVLAAALAGRLARNGPSGSSAFMEQSWPLIALNSSVLGVLLHSAETGYSFSQSLLSALSVSLLFGVSLVLLTAIRARMDEDALPETVKGLPVLLLTAALISMALMGLNGL